MKRICCLGSVAMIALALSGSAPAAPAAGSGLPPEYTADDGLVEIEVKPVTKEDVARTAQTPAEVAAIKGSLSCWQVHARADRGHLVYYRAVNQLTFWCSDWRVITYRTTETWPDTGALCSVAWGPQSWRSGGGAGYWHVDVTSRGGFSCWIYRFEYRDWIEFTIRFTAYGSAYSV